MAKLYFRYGAVGSAKTLNLLAVSHNYRSQGKEVLLLKPSLDDRFGVADICSRAGLKAKADLLMSKESCFFYKGEPLFQRAHHLPLKRIDLEPFLDFSCILVDEAQFLSAEVIDDLYLITIKFNIPVIAYGLKTDFQGRLFEGAQRLLELSDRIEEIKTTCFYCQRKATQNLRLVDEKPTFEGETIELGADERYKACCKSCFYQFKKEAVAAVISNGARGLQFKSHAGV